MIISPMMKPGMTGEKKKMIELWIKSNRAIMLQQPTFQTKERATKEAVALSRRDPLSDPSVWKQPKDVGKQHTVVVLKHRENAYIAGYEETVDAQEVYDISIGRGGKDRYDEIEDE